MANTDASPAAKKAVAKHALINSSGQEVDDEESATGIRYTLLANGESFEYQYGKNSNADRMLANFGAKTLATNETSQARNNAKGPGSPDEQIAAVRDRFALLQDATNPQWVDRTREPGVGIAIDKDALVRAIARFAGENGQTVADDKLVALRQKVEEDKIYVRKVRQHPRVAALYAEETGKPMATVDDVLSGI